MKKTIILLCAGAAALVSMTGCQSAGPKRISTDSTYAITGKVEGMDSGWIYALHRQADPTVMDSAKVIKGAFLLTGKATNPEFCLLGFARNGNKEFRKGVFLQSGDLTFTAKKDSMESATVGGVPSQDELVRFAALEKPIDSVSEILELTYSSAAASNNKVLADSVMEAYKGLEKSQHQMVRDYARTHPASYVAAYKIYSNFSNNPDPVILDSIYKGLDSTLRQSFFGVKIREALESAEKTAIGREAPVFTLPDTKGQNVALTSYRGKITLVDFWASWCGPCRQENPNVVKAYQKYHPKGFNILSVSLDNNKDKWLEAIRQDKLNWGHVSDLKGWQSDAAKLYGVRGIPTNFLLDKDGKIIAKDLRGDDLEKKLAEVVKM